MIHQLVIQFRLAVGEVKRKDQQEHVIRFIMELSFQTIFHLCTQEEGCAFIAKLNDLQKRFID